jgi:Fur family transcriptional regulator, ferric uptake regulator
MSKLNIGSEMTAFTEAIRQRGLSATPQRMAIAQTVFSTHDHFTAEDLVREVRRTHPRVGRVTVYRTLKVLVDSGLVEERQFRKDRVLYEHTVGHRHHDHMVCVNCGLIIEFESPVIEREQAVAASRRGFQVLYHQHVLFGRCRKCGRAGGSTLTK